MESEFLTLEIKLKMREQYSEWAKQNNVEELVSNGKKKFVRFQEGAKIYSMGLHTFQGLAREAGAVYKIRQIALVNTEIFEEFLENFRENF